MKDVEFYKHFHNNKSLTWFSKMKLSHEIKTINRCKLEHHNLASCLAQIGIVDSAKCQCNYKVQDLNHIV